MKSLLVTVYKEIMNSESTVLCDILGAIIIGAGTILLFILV